MRSGYLNRRAFIKRTPMSPLQKKVRSRNAKRARENWARAYGSEERVEWVKSLPCAACGVVGFSENAHTVGGGGSRKADADTIAPLCGPGFRVGRLEVYEGCHARYDQRKGIFAAENVRQLVKEAAVRVAAAWLARGAS